MTTDTTTELASFHEFVSRQLKAGCGAMSPEEVLALWRNRSETIVALQEGLNAVETGRTKPVKQFVDEFRVRHGLADDA